jgi:hemerythrin-like domain-containing protein
MKSHRLFARYFLPAVLSVAPFVAASCAWIEFGHGAHDPQAAVHDPHHARPAEQDPSVILEDEHRLVVIVADEAAKEAAQIRQSGQVDRARVEKMTPFFTNFVDHCHHAKEERYYFPALLAKNPGDFRPLITELENEHEQGREILRGLAADLQRDDLAPVADRIADSLEQYAFLIRAHIRKETERLFPQAESVLSVAERVSLVAEFDRIEREEMGEGSHERYHKLAAELGHLTSIADPAQPQVMMAPIPAREARRSPLSTPHVYGGGARRR